MNTFMVQVFDKKSATWKDRGVRLGKDANEALKRGYGVSGTRPYNGQAKSKSGKLFRAVPHDNAA